MILDYDPTPGSEAMPPGQLVESMRLVCPPLFNAPILHRPSVSSGIRTFGGQPLTGVRGQRLYIAVADTSLIPKAGKALEDLLWATGHGYVVIGKAGQILSRTLIDGSVWQPERLDFAAPPLLAEGLTRDQPANWLCGNDAGDPLDLRKVIEMADGTVVTAAVRAKDTAKAGVQSEAQTVLGEWVEVQAEKLSKARKIPLDTARATVARAAVKRQLTGDFLLTTPDGAQVSVGEMLDHLDRWHGKRFADPLEPDYGNDSRIAWANLRSGGRPYVYSHAHGGRRFYLIRPSARIQLADGQRARVVDSLLDLMRTRRELYDMGGGSALARVTDDAKAIPANQDWLVDHFDRTVEFFSIKEAKEGPDEVPRNAPVWAARAILAKDGERRLSRLDAVVTAPTLRVDGSIISEPGYDPVSRLLFLVDTPDSIHVPLNPTFEQARAALSELWEPFRLFPLVDTVDHGVVLAGILSALIRPSLATCPGFAFDAPAAGSGKTLLAQTIGALLLGVEPAALPPASNQDEETRKRLFSTLRDGSRVLLWDNVREPLGNGALDAFLTAPTFSDRILGKSEMATLPNRALFLVTGNNLRLVGDTCRRILTARIDPRMERPYARSFGFCPLQTVLGKRLRMVAAGLTLVRAWIAHGRIRLGDGRTASFESWDDLIRQTLCWVASWDSRFADPLKATERAFELDPETSKLKTLLATWHAKFGDTRMSVAEIVRSVVSDFGLNDQGAALRDALDEVAGERGTINRRRLGRWIEKNAERRVDGLRIVRRGILIGATTWAVVRDTNPERPDKTHHN
ncbi:MAG: hypothetical protein WCP34_14745, partial [Pseudomonadota bacterium]